MSDLIAEVNKEQFFYLWRIEMCSVHFFAKKNY